MNKVVVRWFLLLFAPVYHRLISIFWQFLTACEAAFSHCVPSPALHEITTIAKVVEFYETPVTGTNGLTQFQQMPDLPPNLHISYEPIRFDPENDPYYGGISAFPGQSVVVQGLKARKIFKSHQAENNWPRVMDTFRRNSKVVPKYQPAERPR